jgi:hypothetical protein
VPSNVQPIAGEPSSRELGEARLISKSCQDYEQETTRWIAEHVRMMRAEVTEAFEHWSQDRDALPRSRAQCTRAQAERRKLWGQEIGEAFGSGGIGLSGIGEGGGGRGKGMGLGAAGTRSRSAAVSGFGSGHGRLGGSHKSGASRAASQTNNQVAGVDEADIVKNDGRYVYLTMNGALRIVRAAPPALVSVTKLPGSAKELFVRGDRAAVYVALGGSGASRCTYGYDCSFSGDGSRTKILVYDLSRRTRPRLVRDIELSGSLLAARSIGNAVHTVVSDQIPRSTSRYPIWPDGLDPCASEAEAHARFTKLTDDNEQRIRAGAPTLPTITEKGVTKPLCEAALRSPLDDGHAFTTLVSFDVAQDQAPVHSATVESRPGAVAASADHLYLSVRHEARATGGRWYSFYASVDELSDVHMFRIGEDPAQTRYVGSGVVPGHVLNQFAMDERAGYLRIATTLGRVPDPAVRSAVSILAETPEGSLVRVGAIEHLAPGEDIRSVRFDDDRAYVVTFKKTDPLFVLDLAEPDRPRILGELEIPGFSTYMHRIDPDHLLSIGFDANDHGSFAFFDGVILQLFDVKEPTRPRLLFKQRIGTRGSSSEALTNHLAFTYLADQNLLAIPMTICEGGGDGRFGGRLSFSGLMVYEVTLDQGFRRLGGVDHGTRGQSCDTWWSQARSAVKRSVFIDDLVFSIATDRMKVQRLAKLGADVADFWLM